MMRHRLEMLGVAAVSLLIIYAADPPSPFYDYTGESPGTTHKITVGALPAPISQHDGVASPEPQPPPDGAMPKTLPGNEVHMFASDLTNPAEVGAAPNGDSIITAMAEG